MIALKTIDICLETAKMWEQKRDSGYAVMCYENAVLGYLSVSVSTTENREQGVNYLRANYVPHLLERLAFWQHTLVEEVDAGKKDESNIAGNYQYLVLAQLSLALENHTIGNMYIEHSLRPDVQSLGTNFWNEYANALFKLAQKIPYKPSTLLLNKTEQYWLPYLNLISDFSNGRDPNNSITAAQTSLKVRQNDKNMEDANQIEGSPINAVKWDFRLEFLLNSFSPQLYRASRVR